MAGRQSTGPRPAKRAKPRNKAQKRTLNALAIASKQNPERTKIRQSRLGDADSIEKSRHIRGHANVDASEGNNGHGNKGERTTKGSDVEEGSDSEGNEWRIGHVDSNDDSDLDSDEAFGESDEERFEGFTFRGSTSGAKKPGVEKANGRIDENGSDAEIDLNEDEGDSQHDEENKSLSDLGEDAVDLAEMLDDSDEGELQPGGSKKRKAQVYEKDSADDSAESEVDDDDDDDEDSSLSLSDAEDENNDPARLSALQELVASIQPDPADEQPSKRRRMNDGHETSTPSDFGITSSQKLTLADLQSTVTDPHLKQSLKLLDPAKAKKRSGKRTGIPGKLNAPLEKRQQDPLDRAAAYQMTKEQLKRWEDTVIHNRRADHLMFPLQDSSQAATSGNTRMLPTSTTGPTNDLERAIQEISEMSGLASANNGKSEEQQIAAFEELQTNKMPLEEVQARRAELRKLRDLMFFEEKRAKRIKSIKSKKYRREHRRDLKKLEQGERDALAAAGEKNSDDDREEHDRRRAMARMGAKVRDSKFSKGLKESGRAEWDADARSAVLEKAKSEEDLRRRIEGNTIRDEDGSMSEPSSDDEEDNNQDIRSQIDRTDGKQTEESVGSKLFSMPFMQKADAARKAQNDADQESFLRELDGDDTSSDSDVDLATSRRKYGPTSKRTSTQYPRDIESNGLDGRQSDSGDEEAGDRGHTDDPEEDIEIVLEGKKDDKATAKPDRPFKGPQNNKQPRRSLESGSAEIEDNPWLKPASHRSRSRQTQKSSDIAPATISNTFSDALPLQQDPAPAKPRPLKSILKKPASKPTQEPPSNPDNWTQIATNDLTSAHDSENDSDNDAETTRLPFALRNHALAQRVFAGDEVVPSFEKEKRQAIADDEEKIIDNTLPGWGSWTGEGISKKAATRNTNRFLVKSEGIKAENRKDAKLKGVIISEKRIKKNAKYLASQLPHPFETRQQYERSLRLPVGPEWTTKETFQNATKPRVMIKQGVIAPMLRPLL
ncbi:MAG: hypothetical protein M1835_004900 [Candelina submexicana]|nr:MAG: hypothetical protein M1835_004900 [Candelina submexicana]